MSVETTEKDYVLGTHDEEIQRLGLQHRIWRPKVLECWREAGIKNGSRVLDIGAGPGYATLDLAELVGPEGLVVALERSARFLAIAKSRCAALGQQHVQFHEMDLMEAVWPAHEMDAAWCRWVACFVSNPPRLIQRIASSLKIGGRAIFHEYADYQSFRIAPRQKPVEDFVIKVMESWRAMGGEPEIALELPQMLHDAGFEVTEANPIALSARPGDFYWSWPASFIEINLKRLMDLGRVDAAWTDSVRDSFRQAENNPASVLITPLVLELVAVRVR